MIAQGLKKETVTKVNINITLETAEEVELFNRILENAEFEQRRRTIFPSDEPIVNMIQQLKALTQ